MSDQGLRMWGVVAASCAWSDGPGLLWCNTGSVVSDFGIFFQRSQKFFLLGGGGSGEKWNLLISFWFFNVKPNGLAKQTTGCQLSTATFPLLRDVMVPQNEPRKAHGLQLSVLRLSTLAKGHLNLSGPRFPHLQSGPNDVRLTHFTQFFPWIE